MPKEREVHKWKGKQKETDTQHSKESHTLCSIKKNFDKIRKYNYDETRLKSTITIMYKASGIWYKVNIS